MSRMTLRRDKPSKPRGATLTRAASRSATRSNSAELDARMLVGAALGLDLTGLIAAASRLLTPDESTRLEDFARRRLGGEPVARILGAQGILGTAAATLGRDAGAAARHRNGGRAGAGNAARRARVRIAGCASPTSAPARARFCWRCCPNCLTPMGVGTDISVAGACERHAATPSILGWPIAPAFVACDYAAALSGAVRSDRVEPALYPLGRYRRPRHRGPRSRSASRARRRRGRT